MPTITITPEEMPDRNYALEGGKYGRGLDTDAEVKIIDFQYPALQNPGYDKDGTQGPWALFNFSILLASGEQGFSRMYINNLVKLAGLLTTAGVPVAGENGNVSFDPEEVAPREVGGIEVKPRRDFTRQDGTEGSASGDTTRIYAA